MYKGLKEVHNARVLYIDMNAFFASVEQQVDPLLRNRPLAVVSHRTAKGTVLAASYEAKAFGITTGTKVGQAYEYCPELLTREPRASLYRTVHRRFMEILYTLCGPEVHARSVDEAVYFLAPNQYGSLFGWQLAYTIKQEFARQLGAHIRCSIGIAPNSFLAKLATNLQKPDGLVEITLENTEEILAKLALTDLTGIAERNAIRLSKYGITTPLEFYHTPAITLYKQFGIWGQYWWWRLHGFEADESWGMSPHKSISHQHVLKRWPTTREQIEPIITRMSDRLIHRLQRNHLACRHISLYVSLSLARPLWAEQTFDAANSGYLSLLHTIQDLTHQFPTTLPGQARMVVIAFSNLSNESTGLQLDLFQQQEKQEKLSQAIASIRSRHGFAAIQLGNVVRLDHKVAEEQLGFGRIKDTFPKS